MGVFEKIKNALFEVEYVEVDELPKKEKKVKEKEKDVPVFDDKEEVIEKPIAKKIVLPGKKEVKVETLEEEELIDDNFESRPIIEEKVKENLNNKFNYVEEEPVVEEEFENSVPEIV